MIKCFVSFCVEDARDIDVQVLVAELTRRTEGTVSFLVYFQKDYGDSLSDFMRLELNQAEACLILFGPKYKHRIDETVVSSGAYQEYDSIVSRLEDRTTYSKPRVIPVLWAGKKPADSFPQYFQNMNTYAGSLTHFRAHGITQAKEAFLPNNILDQYDETLQKIADILKKESEITPPGHQGKLVEKLEQMLHPELASSNVRSRIEDILKLKYEHQNYDAATFKEKYFTNTLFFRNLVGKNLGLISGRKGSGKTTLVQIREHDAVNSEYFPVIDIEVNNWNLHYIIQSNVFRQAESDFEFFDIDDRFFDFVWISFLGFCVADSLARHKSDNSHGNLIQELIAHGDLAAKFKELHASAAIPSSHYYSTLFELSVTASRSFIQSVVDNADSTSIDSFRLDATQRITVRALISSLFGVEFGALRKAIQNNGSKRFLFCFDRFDSEIQRYRKESIERDRKSRQVRAKREIEWLSSLTLLIEKIRRPDRLDADRSIYEFFERVRFLVVLPYDRIIEIKAHLRDAVANEAVEEISWQPFELLTMLRKRIQAIYKIEDAALQKKPGEHPRDRYVRCLTTACPLLPETADIFVGGKRYEMDLFLNVLRHSFFRPRDVLIYYSSILTNYDALKQKERRIDAEALRLIISTETRTIVNFEFIGELRDTWTNIEGVLARFKGGNQILDSRALDAAVGPVNFEFYNHTSVIVEVGAKIEFLYRLGFIGFKATRSVGRKSDQDDYVFSFLEPQRQIDFSSPEMRRNLTFAIHPIFIETLFLRVNGDEPVLNLTWDQLRRRDRVI